MDVGIGLPNTVRGVDRAGTVEWARRAEQAGEGDGAVLLRARRPGRGARREDLGDYYAVLGDVAEQIIASAATDADTVMSYLSAFEEAGCDEVMC
ncbi:MAG: hypothetical protein ACRDKH_09745, partial [Solirubrobacterales bacterium]